MSADIPKHIAENVKNNKKKLGNMQVPYMLNGFHPVLPFKEEDEADDSNTTDIINIDSLNLAYDNTEV